MTTPAEALKAVAKVLEERGEQNGNFEENFKNIAQVWTWWLKIRRGLAADLDASDVAALMTLFKMARMLTGTLNRDDHYDNLGYGALLWGCMAEKIEVAERAGTNKSSRRALEFAVGNIPKTLVENYVVAAKEAVEVSVWTTAALEECRREAREYREHVKKTGNFFNPDETLCG